MSDSVRPHRRKPTRLPCPWDSPGKKTRVDWPFPSPMHESKKWKEVAQSCPILSDPMDYSPPGSSIHGIFKARVLEWGVIDFSDFHLILGLLMYQAYFACLEVCASPTFAFLRLPVMMPDSQWKPVNEWMSPRCLETSYAKEVFKANGFSEQR